MARELGERAGEWQQVVSRRLGQWWTLRPRFGATTSEEPASADADELSGDAGSVAPIASDGAGGRR